MPPIAATYRRQPFNSAASGDVAAIAGLTGYRYAVHGLKLVAAAPEVITIKDGAGTSLTGPISLIAGVPYEHDVVDNAWYETSNGNAFVINKAGTVQVSGAVWYRQL